MLQLIGEEKLMSKKVEVRMLKSKAQERWLKENKPNVYALLADSLPEGTQLPERIGSKRLSEKRRIARENYKQRNKSKLSVKISLNKLRIQKLS